MIGEAFFGAASPALTLVNTARGAVVDVPRCWRRSTRGTLAGAALDVLPVEPVPRDSPLLAASACDPDAARGVLFGGVGDRSCAARRRRTS